ncbi:MAG: CNNM domain-containing protein [Candidatus Neomarinimicrobiota bacterium]
MTFLIIYFSLALVISFICSLMEAVLLSITHTHIAVLIKDDQKTGFRLKKLKEQVNRPLAAILTLNTIANTVGAAGVGAQALLLYGSKWVALASAILTLSILIFSEIIPKTLGTLHWKFLSGTAAFVIQGMIYITYPFVILLEAISQLLTTGKTHGIITREEMVIMAELGEDDGTIHEKETHLIENILKLNNITADEVLTPRSVIFAFQKDQTVGEVMDKNPEVTFSRIPIYTDNIDTIVGIVHRYDLQNKFSEDDFDATMESFMTPVDTVLQSESVAAILDKFIQKGAHIFVVQDEFGGTEGIITLEDAVETLLGVEIVDEFDDVADMRKFAREKWRKQKLDAAAKSAS